MSNVMPFIQAIMSAEDSFSAIKDCPVEFEREKQFAMQICNSNEYLQKPQFLGSLCNAVRNVALSGITLNPVMKLAYLVPRDGAICLDISYMGLIKIATDSGSVSKVSCQIVYEKDFFEVSYGTEDTVIHKPLAFGERGDVVGVYCVATLHDGLVQIETMCIEEVNKIRGRSKAFTSGKSCPWKTDYLEMVRKTCVKRAAKYWNKTERLSSAIELDHANNGNVEYISNNADLDLDEVISLFESAKTLAKLDSITNHAAKLPKADKEKAKEVYTKRKRELSA